MIGIVLAGHGELGHALVATARSVVAHKPTPSAVAFGADDTPDSFSIRLKAAIAEADQGRGVLILTDMFGGSPSNISLTLHEPTRVEIVTGANLPMLIKALQLCDADLDLSTAAQRIAAAGHRSIVVATEVLSAQHAGAPSP